MPKPCTVNDPEKIRESIREDIPIPSLPRVGLSQIAAEMPLGACAYGITEKAAKAMYQSIRKLGFGAVMRRVSHGDGWAVWKVNRTN